jgi:hypothetical protein
MIPVTERSTVRSRRGAINENTRAPARRNFARKKISGTQLDPPRSVLAHHAAGVDKSHPRPPRTGPASSAAKSDPSPCGQSPRHENHTDPPRTGPESSAAEVACYSSPQLSHPRSGPAPPAASAVSNQHVTPAAPKDRPFSEAVGSVRLGQPAPDPPRHPSPQRASAAHTSDPLVPHR